MAATMNSRGRRIMTAFVAVVVAIVVLVVIEIVLVVVMLTRSQGSTQGTSAQAAFNIGNTQAQNTSQNVGGILRDADAHFSTPKPIMSKFTTKPVSQNTEVYITNAVSSQSYLRNSTRQHIISTTPLANPTTNVKKSVLDVTTLVDLETSSSGTKSKSFEDDISNSYATTELNSDATLGDHKFATSPGDYIPPSLQSTTSKILPDNPTTDISEGVSTFENILEVTPGFQNENASTTTDSSKKTDDSTPPLLMTEDQPGTDLEPTTYQDLYPDTKGTPSQAMTFRDVTDMLNMSELLFPNNLDLDWTKATRQTFINAPYLRLITTEAPYESHVGEMMESTISEIDKTEAFDVTTPSATSVYTTSEKGNDITINDGIQGEFQTTSSETSLLDDEETTTDSAILDIEITTAEESTASLLLAATDKTNHDKGTSPSETAKEKRKTDQTTSSHQNILTSKLLSVVTTSKTTTATSTTVSTTAEPEYCGIKYRGKCYYLLIDEMNYYDSSKECRKIKGKLSDIDSRQHYITMVAYIRKLVPSKMPQLNVWTAMTLMITTGKVRLSTMSTATFTNWYPGQPARDFVKRNIYLRVPKLKSSYQGMVNYDPQSKLSGALCVITKRSETRG